MSNLLTVTDLSMAFGGLVAVDHISFAVKLGSITAMIGPNGAGKTTVFNCVTRFYTPTSGQMVLTPEPDYALDLHTLSPYKVAKKARVLRTFQNIRLFGQMSVLENVHAGIVVLGGGAFEFKAVSHRRERCHGFGHGVAGDYGTD